MASELLLMMCCLHNGSTWAQGNEGGGGGQALALNQSPTHPSPHRYQPTFRLS